ncbi:putative phospholipase B-like 2, partial [Ophiophagus hannah]
RWAALELTTNEKYNDSIQAYAAGVAEAAVSEQLVYMHWMNTMVSYCGPFTYWMDYCQKLKNYIEANLNWMEEQMEQAGMDSAYWYQVSLETTIGNNNNKLWKFIKPDNSVLEWLRNIVANRLARTGAEWATIFEKFNSGTYFQDIFNTSGLPALVQKYGDWFTYEKTPRAQIFRRNQTLIRDMDSMIRLMRFNNFPQDPLSQCQGCNPPQNGENAIAARSDLNPANGTYPFGALYQRRHGGTDMKVTSFEMMKNYSFLAASGPTWDNLPPFQWSSSPFCNISHMGQPDLWKFSPIQIHWD